jgi:hypothetical protein
MEAPKPKNFPVENRFKKWVRLLDQILNWESEKNFRDPGAFSTPNVLDKWNKTKDRACS